MTDVSNVPPARRQIPKRTRFEVLRRDSYTCRYCGAQAPDVPLTVDHVVPVALGGGDEPSNLVTACRDCNYGKASTSPDEHTVADVDADAQRWAEALNRAAEIRRAQSRVTEHESVLQIFYNRWTDTLGSEWGLISGDWEPSIVRFYDSGLTVADMAESIAVVSRNAANLRQPFRYFCSLAWSEIETRQALAEQLIREAD